MPANVSFADASERWIRKKVSRRALKNGSCDGMRFICVHVFLKRNFVSYQSMSIHLTLMPLIKV